MTTQHQTLRIGMIIIIALALFFGGRELLYMGSSEIHPLLIEMSMEELEAKSDLIIRGIVKKSIGTSRYTDGSGERVVGTRWRVQVTEVLKGTPQDPLIVRTLGGRYGLMELWVEDEAVFTAGEEAILFLEKDPSSEDFRTVGLSMGHFTIQNGEAVQQESGSKQSVKVIQDAILAE